MLRIPGARPVKLIPKPKTSNPNITTTKISTRSSVKRIIYIYIIYIYIYIYLYIYIQNIELE